MAASHQTVYNMNINLQQLCNIIRSRAFADHLRLELKSENPTPTGVWYRFHHGASFSSWGEKITITLTPMGNEATQVIIHSECGMPTQVIDWGKNKRVVCNIYDYLAANARHFSSLQPPVQPVQPVTPVQPLAQPAQPQPSGGFCPNCGHSVAPQANFCTGCGAKLR